MSKYVEVYCEFGHKNFVLKSNLGKHKSFRCKECLTIKRNKESASVGITLLEQTDNRHYGLYRLSCGCVSRIKYGHVKDNNFKCGACQAANQKDKEEKLGLVEIKRLDGRTSLYFRKSCGHTLEMNRSCLTPACKLCKSEKHTSEASLVNLEIVSPSDRGNLYRVYRFKDCGHTQTISLSRVRDGVFACKTCQDIKIEQEASRSGLSVVGLSTTDNKNRLYRAECGHILDLSIGNVRVGSWTCHTCNDTYYVKPNNLYLLKIKNTTDNFEFLKLGFSKNVDRRATSYGADYCNITILKVVTVPTGEIAYAIEQQLHSKYSAYNLNHRRMKEYLNISGFTECYNLEIQDALLQELELQEREFNA